MKRGHFSRESANRRSAIKRYYYYVLADTAQKGKI